MKIKESEIKSELKAVLGKPKYYIDTPGFDDDERYFWFPTIGDSMTDNTKKSIPSGSMVLARLLKLNNIKDIPLHQPVVFIIHYEGEQFCLLKTAAEIIGTTTEINNDSQKICLRSYNPSPRCDDLWVPFNCIKFIFVVEKVRLPNNEEFVPKQVKIVRKKSN